MEVRRTGKITAHSGALLSFRPHFAGSTGDPDEDAGDLPSHLASQPGCALPEAGDRKRRVRFSIEIAEPADAR
jgi:hypothetical protein